MNAMNAMQPPQNIEEIKAGLETTEKGGVRQSIRNCLTVFQRDPLLSGAIAYNILTDRKDIIKPIGFHRESTALNDTDMKYLLLYLEETYGLTNEKKIDNAIGIVANENKYHPIRDYLSALVWDGTERIRFCLRHFLGADADDYTYEALKLFLLGAISRAFQPGCKFEIMLCLVGGQGAGKSTFFRLLAVRDEWFSDDLRKLDDDNVYRKLQGHWIIEMSEMMATANAKSIEEIKSFLSRQKEVYKIPYETHPADRPRQCVFGGTSNALDFLPLDRSGNRRFIPVMVYPEQAEVHILEDEAASRAYIERESCTNEEFYEKMRAAKGIPSTAAITPIQFCEKYCQYVDEGYTDVIHVPINRSGSSTYNNAVMAQGMLREERPEHHLRIHLLDPHTYSMPFGWYVCEMARKLQNGAEISHVIQEFETQMDKMEIVLGPYSLKQMKKSGRISAAAAVMGELMGIRPIITLIDGKTKVEAKVRGDDKVVPAMVELAKKRSEGVEDFDYMIGHTNIPQKDDLIKACRKAFGKDPLITFPLGGVVSANTGPDTIALVYVGHTR